MVKVSKHKTVLTVGVHIQNTNAHTAWLTSAGLKGKSPEISGSELVAFEVFIVFKFLDLIAGERIVGVLLNGDNTT